MRRLVLGVALLLTLTACGGDSLTTETSATSSPPGTISSTVATTAAPGTSSSTTPATTTQATTTTPTTESSAASTLPDGRPATFVAITDDYQAVEVDTTTGEVIHVFGQTGTAAEMDAAEEMPPNVLVGAWRISDGSMIGLSDCCEPAAGRLFFLSPEEDLGEDPYSSSAPWTQGWTLSPSPNSNFFASIGYSLEVFPEDPQESGIGVWIDEPSLGFPGGAAAWARDGSQLWWTTKIKEVTALATLELPAGEPRHVTVLPWVGVHQYLDGIGTQTSGNLVGFLHTYNDEFEVAMSEGVVFSDSGEVLADFPVETNSLWGGYDQSGRFLIYVDGDNTVRWQGLGMSGSLAEGFIFASW
jgi:hypothetical protein